MKCDACGKNDWKIIMKFKGRTTLQCKNCGRIQSISRKDAKGVNIK